MGEKLTKQKRTMKPAGWKDRVIFQDDPHGWPKRRVLSNGWEAHVHCDGARFHVSHWSGYSSRKTFETFGVAWCSEPFCDMNREAVLYCIEHGIDPSRACSSPDLKSWLDSPAGRAALASQHQDKP